ncbi:VIT domain-containing protein [Flavobacterium branchiophilum]|uniref:TonB-dependent receptor n=1 Tax=Flavobacterium branchiophilum TaxID=55197 RepID=A0A2H3KCN4_9FLAO|nr:VIT domain-containing protein [Flavobacterium branchiophilum]PDS25180.1 TonB-dependent receptor [Flavobacterium branchiophilum]
MKNIRIIIVLLFVNFSFSQSPKVTIKSGDTLKVKMNKMITNVKIVGNIAYTTTEMHFVNTSNRQMEAALVFPLPEGVTVSRYAIDINGKLRESVPVNKNKGKQVFEAIEHRRVDPGLLEKVDGNNFKTRIYPILPNTERIVVIGYEQALQQTEGNQLDYHILSTFSNALDRFEINIDILNPSKKPEIHQESSENNIILTENSFTNSYQTKIIKENYKPNENINIKIPINKDIPNVYCQNKNEQVYFYGNIFLNKQKIARKKPNTIALIWDNSLSCKNRDLNKEFALLDAYFKNLNQVRVQLYYLNYKFQKNESFEITNGNWEALKNTLKTAIYDGGTRFSEIQWGTEDEILFFTDGLSSLSSSDLPKTNKPLYTISSLASSDFAYMNYQSLVNKGAFINLNQINTNEAIEELTYQKLKFLGIKENNFITELYPIAGVNVSNNFNFSGISLKKQQELTLLFGYQNEIVLEKTIVLDAEKAATQDIDIEKLWVQNKISSLDLQYDKNEEAIEILGKKYGIITRNTSLIVLETVEDYIRYDILPPVELKTAYDQIAKQNKEAMLAQQKNNWINIAQYNKELDDWWNKNLKFVSTKQPKKESKSGRLIRRISNIKNKEINSENETDKIDTVSFVKPQIAKSEETINFNSYKTLQEEVTNSNDKDGIADEITNKSKEVAVIAPNATSNTTKKPKTKVTSWSPDRVYLKVLEQTPAENKYAVYLELKEEQENNPNYYFDVAQYFYRLGQRDKALQILSNIADLGLENHQLYKTLTYVFRQWKSFDDAVFTASTVAKWRTIEPQAHRDLAMALEDNKQIQAAFDELIKALKTNYLQEMSGQYEGIEDIILMDLNRLSAENPSLNTNQISKRYLNSKPIDVRIILNWNMMDTDIDLHIIEPTGEECYYAHKETALGARFSKDFTQGYGPEQYLLRNAVKGKYQIKTNYFGESSLTENGPSTVMVEIYTSKNGKTEKKIHTIQLGKVKENHNLAEINF